MKLHKLRLCNLNSLQGIWEINFASEALLSEGIFLITGPTGAGKSTILDAICLALYGRTPRLGRITKSSNEIISRGAAECFAQLSFSAADGKLYHVHWRQHRARNNSKGNLQEPERELSLEETGEILAARINEVEEQIPKISGLEYEQFLRSILLAQGDFAAFMESSTPERAEILEKITGTGIYREVSKLCYQRWKQAQNELQLQEEQQKVLLPLPDEQRRELEEATEAAQGQLQQMDGRQKQLYKVLQHYKSLEQFCQEQQHLQQNIATLPDHKNDCERLAQDAQAQKLEPLHQKWQESLEQLKNKKDSIQKQSTEQSERSEQVGKLKIELSEAEVKLQNSQKIHKHFLKQREQLKELEWNERENGKALSQGKKQMAERHKQLAKTETSVGKLQAQLQEKSEAIAELQHSLNKSCLSPNIESIQNVQNVQDTELESLRYRARQLSELQIPAREWRKQYERLHTAEIEAEIVAKIAEGKAVLEQLKKFELPTLELQPLPRILQLVPNEAEAKIEIEQREDILNCAIESCQLLISPLARYLLEYQQYSESLHQSQETKNEVQQQEKELAKVQEDLKKQEKELKRQERYCETLRKNLELHQHLLLFERERKQLQHGEPCPLCGATEHNFSLAPAAPKESQATHDELKKQEQTLLELHNAVQGDQNEATKLANQLTSSKDQAKKQHAKALHLQGELTEQGQLLQNILQKYQTAGFAAQALLPKLWQMLQNQSQDQTQEEQSQANVQAQALQAEFDDCQEQLKTFQNAENQAFETHQKHCEQLQEEYNAQIRAQEKRLSDLQTQQHQAELQAKEWQSFCAKIREDFVRLYSPYVQYLQEIDSQKNSADISPEEQKLLQAVEQAQSVELLLQVAENETLQATLKKRSTDLQQALSNWQTQQEMQSQIPLLEERSNSAEQQQQSLEQQAAELAQQIAEGEAESKTLRDSWQKKIADLFEELSESAGQPLVGQKPFIGSEFDTEQLEENIEKRLQASEAHKDKIKSQSSELEKQLEVIQQLLANAQKECEALQKKCDKALQNWKEALSHSTFFATAEDFLAAKLPAQQRTNIEKQIRDTEQKQSQWQARIRELEQQIAKGFAQAQNLELSPTLATPKMETQIENQAEQALRNAEQQLQESYKSLKKEDTKTTQDLELAHQHIQALVSKELEEAQNRGNAIREELGAQKQRLTSDDTLRQKLEQNAAQLQQKRQELKHWELLNELIGSAQGDKYSLFAQQLSFEQLIYHANFYLERVSDRYLLQSLPEHPLEFFVTDLYQLEGQSLRPSSNLSGGEKFLISLSLSLALSKISANKVPVQSLFLDEGFGTLDEEALHSTLEVLASLSNDGKLIGLISHISTLRERIMCQIQLESIGEGRSLIHSSSGSGDIVQKISDPSEKYLPQKHKEKESKQNKQTEQSKANKRARQAEEKQAEENKTSKAKNTEQTSRQAELF